MFFGLPEDRFDVVLADPPWSYYGSTDGWGDAAKFYELVDDADLFKFPMRRLMNRRSVLFLWATSPKLDVAIRCIEEWELFYRGVAFVWVKTRADGRPLGAQGVRPSIVKPLTEFVLAASPVRTGRPLKLASEKVVQTVLAPKQEHSRKPDEVQERIEELYPDARRLELFARRSRPGWRSWGNEAP